MDISGQGEATIMDDEPMALYAIEPCRVVDTRLTAPLACDGTERALQLAGMCGSVPMAAKAVVVNLTATQQSDVGTLRLYPSGLPPPDTSVLNFVANRAQANNATVLVGSSGQVTVECLSVPSGGEAHLIVDVFGYYR